MKKIFLSADIEGTCGIAHWDETLPDKRDYARFQQQMTREVRAACEGFTCAGVEQLFIRDAHDTARNLLPEQLPENIALFRETLYERVWESDYMGDSRTVDLHVQRLRKKLHWEDKIKAIYKVGYRLEV